MVAEENISHESEPNNSHDKGTIIFQILESIKQTTPKFIQAISSFSSLNENELTQIFVEQLNSYLKNYPFCANSQYHDIINGSTGISDFYFHTNEAGISKGSIFSVEAKRLPAPSNDREKEYVRDERMKDGKRMEGGGIERYKIGSHGNELPECGIVAYIEKDDFKDWRGKINKWIQMLALTDSANWNKSEELSRISGKEKYYRTLKSKVSRVNASDLDLHHFWIKIY